MNRKILFLFLTFALCFNSYSQIIYVRKLATGLNNGTSWANAYTDLSVAINNNAAGKLWVGERTYHLTRDINGNTLPNSRFNTFRLRPDIEIYGGFWCRNGIIAETFWNKIRYIKSDNHNFLEMPSILQNYLNICIKLVFENSLKDELIYN